MSSEARVGVVVVTHNSAEFLANTWQSILNQDYPIARIVVIDDHSTDQTLSLINDHAARLHEDNQPEVVIASALTHATDVSTRIAQNFTQGVRMLTDCDFIAMGDHDDTWYSHRISSQVSHLQESPHSLMLASNGDIGNGLTLFDNFEVPADFNQITPANQLRHVLRYSVATGGATMLRVTPWIRDPSFTPPSGWLHDRWWSIVAASRAGLAADARSVIEYRVSEGQRVGLQRGRQGRSGRRGLRQFQTGDVLRLRALHQLRSSALPEAGLQLRYTSLIRTFMSR